MQPIWMGGEDVDFPNGASVNVITNASFFRSTYSRCALGFSVGGSTPATSNPFSPMTSAWVAFRLTTNLQGQNAQKMLALGDFSTQNGIFIGYNSSQQLCISKVVNGALTTLATSSSLWAVNAFQMRLDAQIASLGVAGTVNLYMNGQLLLSYTGDISIGSPSAVNCVVLGNNNSTASGWVSEIIVSSDSTLGCQGLDIRELIANGTTQQWNNPDISNFDPITVNTANSTYSNTAGQDEQAALANSVAGNFAIAAVKIAAYANAPAGSAINSLKLGLKNTGGTIGVGAPHVLSVGYTTVEDILTTDPTTGQPFTSIDGYQLDLRSA